MRSTVLYSTVTRAALEGIPILGPARSACTWQGLNLLGLTPLSLLVKNATYSKRTTEAFPRRIRYDDDLSRGGLIAAHSRTRAIAVVRQRCASPTLDNANLGIRLFFPLGRHARYCRSRPQGWRKRTHWPRLAEGSLYLREETPSWIPTMIINTLMALHILHSSMPTYLDPGQTTSNCAWRRTSLAAESIYLRGIVP